MQLRSYAKINLSLDIVGRREDGYHNISSLMQDIGLYDDVTVVKCMKSGTKYNLFHCMVSGVGVYLCTCDNTIPVGEDNLAIKGARAILEAMDGQGIKPELEEVYIAIDKKLPIAAGIAGGSGNAAVAMLGINALAGYPFSLRQLMDIGTAVGADVPYSLMMNAKKNQEELSNLKGIEEASTAAMMTGIGDIVTPVEPIPRHIIMMNPGIAVSTRAAYEAIDDMQDYNDKSGLFTNQLEKYTLANYEEARELKQAMEENLNAELVLMSGSGPTMVAYYTEQNKADQDYEKIHGLGWAKPGWRAWRTVTGAPE